MKVLLQESLDLKFNHSSSNQLKFGKGRSYRPKEYVQNSNEMILKFSKMNFNIPSGVPLAVSIIYFYPSPKKGGKPITRNTKDLDSSKAVLDSLMKAGNNINLSNGIQQTMFDDSQFLIETLEKRYWGADNYGLSILVAEIEPHDDMTTVKGWLGNAL